jgi:hypothetical protein
MTAITAMHQWLCAETQCDHLNHTCAFAILQPSHVQQVLSSMLRDSVLTDCGVWLDDAYYSSGGDIATINNVHSKEACLAHCNSTSGCTAVHRTFNTCYLKAIAEEHLSNEYTGYPSRDAYRFCQPGESTEPCGYPAGQHLHCIADTWIL